MNKHYSIQLRLEDDQYEAIDKLTPKPFKTASAVVREATRIGLPWVEHPPVNSIAKETLEGLAIMQGSIALFRNEVEEARLVVSQAKNEDGKSLPPVGPMLARLGNLIQTAEKTFDEVAAMVSQLTALRPLPHSVLLKLKTLAEQQSDLLVEGDPDRSALKSLITAIHSMGVA